jgi:AraC family transcriptional regulator, melibiose operon regulatory protein
MPRPDRHNEIELNLLSAGSLTYLLGGRKETVAAGRLTVFWAAIPHQIIATDSSTYLVATVPLAIFLQWQLPDRLIHALLHGRVVFEESPPKSADDWGMMSRWQHDLQSQPRTEELERAVILEMHARLFRLGLAMPETPSTARSRGNRHALSKAEQMACFVAEHYLKPLAVEDVGRHVNLHPNYAMSLFRDVFNTTLTEYLAQHRVAHAQRLLVTTDEQILAIALASGFGSVSRFNNVFRHACGCSPRDYRRQHRL